MNAQLLAFLQNRPTKMRVQETNNGLYVEATPEAVPDLAAALVGNYACDFATLVVEQVAAGFQIHYFFYVRDTATLIEILTSIPAGTALPAIADRVHAADWHEREAEDLFGISFTGHPFLGDFVLHDEVWPEYLSPMRHQFDARARVTMPGLGENWQPRRILEEEGAIEFPVGPIWADYNESGLWLLATPGEQIHGAQTRLFYKYRAVEKIAEGRTPSDAILLAERFSGSAAFAHAWAFSQALEKISGCTVPPRADALRVVFAEFERIRYHMATIAELTGATALAVGKSMAQEITERLLRLAGEVSGHRYLFGLCAPGGLAWEPASDKLASLRDGLYDIGKACADIEQTLVHTSSFLDRIEEMGTLKPEVADTYGVVGPVARASGRELDLRTVLPYGIYRAHRPPVPREIEGDGYARLRVYFAEIRASTALIEALLAKLPDGPVAGVCQPAAGFALAWVEAPAGGTFHWLRLNADRSIARWRIAPPGFRNWHAFHRALEGAAFQDFHIIMASFGLSIAETDR